MDIVLSWILVNYCCTHGFIDTYSSQLSSEILLLAVDGDQYSNSQLDKVRDSRMLIPQGNKCNTPPRRGNHCGWGNINTVKSLCGGWVRWNIIFCIPQGSRTYEFTMVLEACKKLVQTEARKIPEWKGKLNSQHNPYISSYYKLRY